MARQYYHPLSLVSPPQVDPAWLNETARKDAHHAAHGSFPAQLESDIWKGNSAEIRAVLHRRAQAEHQDMPLTVVAPATHRSRRKLLSYPHRLFHLPFHYRLLLVVYKRPTVIERRVEQLLQRPTTSHFLLDQLPQPSQKDRMSHGG